MKRILVSVIAITLVLGLIGSGTFAYFSDTVVSDENVFAAGTLKMDISNDNANWADTTVTASWHSPAGWAPGMVFTDTVYIKNTGTIDARYLGIDWKKGSNWPDYAEALADHIQVVAMKEYVGGQWNDDLGSAQHYQTLVGNGDNVLTLKELMQSYIVGWGEGTPPTGGTCGLSTTGKQMKLDEFGNCVVKTTDAVTGDAYDITPAGTPAIAANGLYALQMAFKLAEDTPNEYQGKSLTMDISFTGAQDLSQFE